MSKGGSYNITAVTPTIATSFVTDAGTAIPALNILKVIGGEGVDTSGAGNTVTVVAEDATVANKGILQLTTDAEAIGGADSNKAIVSTSLKAKLGTQTNHGVLIGSGTAGAITALSAGTNGQVLIGSTGLDPTFANLTSTDGSVTYTLGAGTLNLSVLGVTQTDVIYVGKFGNDVNDGRSVNKAKLTIQAGETAANAGDTIIVYPGTYTETVTHSKSNLTVIAQGKTNNVIITQADANVIDFGAYTGILYKNFGISCTAATTAINTVQGSTGGCTFKECHLTMTCAAAIAAAVQPAVGSITGAGELKVTIGRVNYAHTGTGGATANKGAFRVADGGTVTLQRINDLTVANSGTALVTAVGVDTASTGVFKMNDNKITVTDPNSTIVAGFVALGGTGTTHEFFRNTVHVTATNNNGYGFWSGDTASSSRFFFNHIHVEDTAGASYSFLVGNGATVISQFDDIIADDGVSITGLGIFTEASSNEDGMLDLAAIGTAKVVTDLLEITNTYNAANMDGTGEGILFRQKAYNATTPLIYDSGELSIVAEQDWTTAAATSRDSAMSFQVALNGTVAEKMHLNSLGYLYVGGSGTSTTAVLTAISDTHPYLLLTTSGASDGRVHFGSANHGVGRGRTLNNDVDLWTTGGSVNIYGQQTTNIVGAGAVTGTFNLLSINNTANAVAMTATGTAIVFNQYYYDATTPAAADAGRIAMVTEGNWTSTASTQDAYMSFETALDGTVTQKAAISSKGVLSIGSGTIDTTAAAVQTIFNGTAPSGAVTNGIEIYAQDSGDSTSTLAIYTEQSVGAGAPTLSHKLKVRINGTEYWLGLDAV